MNSSESSSPLTPDADEAGATLAAAQRMRAAGAGQALRPRWYHPALGLSLFLALASFSVGSAAIGVAIGLVIGPVALETLARERADAAPLKEYLRGPVRPIAAGYVVLVAAAATAGITLEKLSDLTGAAAVAGVLVLVLTVVAGMAADRRRASAHHG